MTDTRVSADLYITMIKSLAVTIVGKHCASAKLKIKDDVFFGSDCEKAFKQGNCYVASYVSETESEGATAEECTYGNDDEEYSFTTTYQDMADFISVGDLKKLGHVACKHGLPCVKGLVGHFKQCAEENDGFYSNVIEEARIILEPLITSSMENADEDVICYYGANSDALKILKMVQGKITSFDDLVGLLDDYVTAEKQVSIVSDVKAGLYRFFDGSREFCDAECVGKTLDFFKGVFEATHDADTCPTVGVYCGGCQNNADSFISTNAGSVPCCTQTALDSITKTITSVVATYGDLAANIEAAVIEAVEDLDVSTDVYAEMRAVAVAQVECLKKTHLLLEDGNCA